MTRIVFEKADAIALVAEVFRALGYEGASMSSITGRTGLSKGSLYHFFPGGKAEMAAAILAHVDAWFVTNIFDPLEREAPHAALARMWQEVDGYFRAGRRACLLGAFALDETRDRFSQTIQTYFSRWIEALKTALQRGGAQEDDARALAEDTVVAIQGALTLARALHDDAIFGRTITRLARRTANFLDAVPNDSAPAA